MRLRLFKRVPDEITELKRESQDLEPLFAEAQELAADGIAYYYQLKAEKMDLLKAEGWPKSALAEAAKAASSRGIWFREHAERLARSISSRIFNVAAAIKSIEGFKP